MPSARRLTVAAFSPDVLDFLRLLQRGKVRCLIIGGEAVIFHGYPRLTGDIDFFYEPTARNAGRLFAALNEFWEGRIPGLCTAEELLEEGVIFQFGRPPNRIDLHNRIDGISFKEAWTSRITAEVGAITVFYIGLGPLRRNKRASGRAKDLDDLEHLPLRRMRKV